jgi:integrase
VVAKKKRGNGEGTIYRRKNGGWATQYTIYTAKGRKRKTIYGKTRQEVAAKLAKALSDREGGFTFDAEEITLGNYMARWLDDAVQGTVRRSTFVRYEQITRVHITPVIGRLKLKSLSPTHVRGLYREKLDSGLAPRTVQYIHTTLHKALKQAVKDGVIRRNVTEAVKAPQPAKKEIQPLNPEQSHAFLEAARGDRFEALYVLAITAGLREGELLGLKWDDLDLEARTLSVRRSLSTIGSLQAFEAPKNGKGRNIKLTSRAVNSLRQHRDAQNEERSRLNGLWEDHGLVFPNYTGKPMRPWSLTGGPFKRLLKRAGLPEKTRLHDLRHTCATLLLSKSTHPKIVQELLGHATISITLDTYSHVLPTMQDQAVAAMESALP